MINDELLVDNKFWGVIEHIESLTHPVLVKDLFCQVDIDEDGLYEILSFLGDFNFKIETDEETGQKVLYPPEVKTSSCYNFSMTENYLINKVENSFIKGQFVTIETFDHRKVMFYVHKLVFLEGELCIVGEDSSTKMMDYHPLSEVQEIKLSKEKYTAQYGLIEVNDFMKAIRAVSGEEIRLVLKVNAAYEHDITPKYQYLGNPFVTSNWNGDKIWAASVEESDYLYEWLLSINEFVDIMDPPGLKQGMIKYCQRKLEEDENDFSKAS